MVASSNLVVPTSKNHLAKGGFFIWKRIDLTSFNIRPAFRAAWQPASIGAGHHRSIHSSSNKRANSIRPYNTQCFFHPAFASLHALIFHYAFIQRFIRRNNRINIEALCLGECILFELIQFGFIRKQFNAMGGHGFGIAHGS